MHRRPDQKVDVRILGRCPDKLASSCKKGPCKGGGVFYNKKTEILPSDAIYELGVVSYPGQGKYHECNTYIAFHELPDQEDTTSEEERKMRSPKGQGWWPVIALQKVAEKTKEGATKTKVLVMCWYQLLEDGRKICWWIYQ